MHLSLLLFLSEILLISVPNKFTFPEVGLSRPPNKYNNVLFPHPEGPIIETNSPLVTLKSIDFDNELKVEDIETFKKYDINDTANREMYLGECES